MTRKTARSSGRLPRLETPEEHERMRRKSPADLRGANYSKIEDKRKKEGKVTFLPVLDGNEDHPMPYYATAEVILPAPAEVPWIADEKKKIKAQIERFSRDTRLQNALLDEVIGDTIQKEITATASIVLEESKYEEETDRNIVGLIEEVFVMPEVQFQVYLNVWSLLYDMGRSLPHKEYLALKEKEDELVLEKVAQEALVAHVLEGEDWADDLTEEKILSEISWDKLIYNYHKNLQENGLANNVALKDLQENLITQAAGAELVKDGLLELLEGDLTTHDEWEKMMKPPRQG